MVSGNRKAEEAFKLMKEMLKETGGYAIIDGGLATELERHGADLNDPLWSAKCFLTSPHLIHTDGSICWEQEPWEKRLQWSNKVKGVLIIVS